MSGSIIFNFAGGNASTVNNVIGSSVSIGSNHETIAVIQGIGSGANILESMAGLASELDTSIIGDYADEIAKKSIYCWSRSWYC